MSHDLHPGDSLRHTANAELSCRARASLEVASGTIFPWDGEARSQPEVAAYISSAACLASPRRPAAPSEAETESKGQPQPGAHCPGFIYSGVKGESDKELQMLKNMGFEKSQRLAGFFPPPAVNRSLLSFGKCPCCRPMSEEEKGSSRARGTRANPASLRWGAGDPQGGVGDRPGTQRSELVPTSVDPAPLKPIGMTFVADFRHGGGGGRSKGVGQRKSILPADAKLVCGNLQAFEGCSAPVPPTPPLNLPLPGAQPWPTSCPPAPEEGGSSLPSGCPSSRRTHPLVPACPSLLPLPWGCSLGDVVPEGVKAEAPARRVQGGAGLHLGDLLHHL